MTGCVTPALFGLPIEVSQFKSISLQLSSDLTTYNYRWDHLHCRVTCQREAIMPIQNVGRCIAFLSFSAFAIAAPKISATHATTTLQVQNPKYPDQKTNSGNPDANDPDSPNNPNNAHGPDKPVNNKSTKPNTSKSSNKTRKSKRINPNKKETGEKP